MRRRDVREGPGAPAEPNRNEHEQHRHLGARQQVVHDAAVGVEVNERQHHDGRDGNEGLPGDHQSARTGCGIVSSGVVSAAAGTNRPTKPPEPPTGGDGAGESGDKRRPAGDKGGQRPEGVAQIDVLTPGVRPKRRQFGIRHGAGEREKAAEDPDPEERPCLRHACATSIGTKKIPLPMTLDTTMAAASMGPSRRASVLARRVSGFGRLVPCTHGRRRRLTAVGSKRCSTGNSPSGVVLPRRFAKTLTMKPLKRLLVKNSLRRMGSV